MSCNAFVCTCVFFSNHGFSLSLYVFPGNSASIESLLESMLSIADDVSQPSNQKAAFVFFNKCVACWGKRTIEHDQTGLPGFDRFIYECIIPLAFRVPSSPNINLKDGQVIVVSFKKASMFLCGPFIDFDKLLFRLYMKFVTSFRRSSRREAKKRLIFTSLFFSLHKIGHLGRH